MSIRRGTGGRAKPAESEMWGAHPGRSFITRAAEQGSTCDRESRVGGLNEALDKATTRGRMVLNMKTDWRAIYLRR